MFNWLRSISTASTPRNPNDGAFLTSTCAIALEKYISEKYHQMKKEKETTHYQSIFHEQKRQIEQGSINPKMLRMLSTHNSKWAVQNAIKLGNHDAEEAQNVASDDDVLSWSASSEGSESSLSLCRKY